MTPPPSDSATETTSRRDFLKLSAGLASGLVVGLYSDGVVSLLAAQAPADTTLAPNAFLTISSTGEVRFILHRSDMGQGARTSVAMLIAEELGVDLDTVVMVQADGDPKYGDQNTDGSTTVRRNYDTLRKAGAAAREMLVAAAAAQWSVPAAECTVSAGEVHHEKTKKKATFGSLAAKAAEQPVPESPALKSPTDWTIVGKPRRLLDAKDVAIGRAEFGIDVHREGMLHASFERCPTKRGSLGSVDDSAALAVPGVRKVATIESAQGLTNAAVAVFADNSWAALEGRKALKIEWKLEEGPHESSAALRRALDTIVSEPQKDARDATGDVEAAVAGAAKVLEAKFHGPHLAHSPMEPLAATAHVTDDGCEIWAPTQHPMWARTAAAQLLGLSPTQVTVHVTLLGGGFGRKSKPDFVLEAVAASKAAGAPVKLTWSREDEIRHGFYRAQNLQWLRGTLDDQGNVTSWTHRTAFPSISSTFNPRASSPSGGELEMGFSSNPYRIPNMKLEAGGLISELRIGWLRSVCHTFHAHAVNGFMDELAVAAGKDPIDLHLELLGEETGSPSGYDFDRSRMRAVIDRVRKMSGWGKPAAKGRGRGFAVHYSFYSYIAMVMEVSVNAEGELKIHRVHCAVDCGRVINPDTVVAQMEGSVAFALTYALHAEITVDNGAVQQSNFHDYPLLRLSEMPPVEVAIMDSDRPPSGMGEPGVPPVSSALTNAIFAATKKRIRDLPIGDQPLRG